MAIQICMLKFLFKEPHKLLDELLGFYKKKNDYEVEDIRVSQELALILGAYDAGLIFVSFKSKADLTQLSSFVKKDSKTVSDKEFRIIVIDYVQTTKTTQLLTKLGIDDIVPQDITPKALKHKIDTAITALLNPAPKKVKKTEASSGQKSEISSKDKETSRISWMDPLDLEDDIWIMDHLEQCKNIMGNWVATVIGPSTNVGRWKKVAKEGWVFEIKESEREIYTPSDGRWVFRSKKPPEISWENKHWIFRGTQLELYFEAKSGKNRYKKIIGNPNKVQIAKNSIHAQMKRDVIIQSFDAKFVFETDAEESGELELPEDSGKSPQKSRKNKERPESDNGKETKSGFSDLVLDDEEEFDSDVPKTKEKDSKNVKKQKSKGGSSLEDEDDSESEDFDDFSDLDEDSSDLRPEKSKSAKKENRSKNSDAGFEEDFDEDDELDLDEDLPEDSSDKKSGSKKNPGSREKDRATKSNDSEEFEDFEELDDLEDFDEELDEKSDTSSPGKSKKSSGQKSGKASEESFDESEFEELDDDDLDLDDAPESSDEKLKQKSSAKNKDRPQTQDKEDEFDDFQLDDLDDDSDDSDDADDSDDSDDSEKKPRKRRRISKKRPKNFIDDDSEDFDDFGDLAGSDDFDDFEDVEASSDAEASDDSSSSDDSDDSDPSDDSTGEGRSRKSKQSDGESPESDDGTGNSSKVRGSKSRKAKLAKKHMTRIKEKPAISVKMTCNNKTIKCTFYDYFNNNLVCFTPEQFQGGDKVELKLAFEAMDRRAKMSIEGVIKSADRLQQGTYLLITPIPSSKDKIEAFMEKLTKIQRFYEDYFLSSRLF